jgi:hypothetical protein
MTALEGFASAILNEDETWEDGFRFILQRFTGIEPWPDIWLPPAESFA